MAQRKRKGEKALKYAALMGKRLGKPLLAKRAELNSKLNYFSLDSRLTKFSLFASELVNPI
jgi:hypothetical protein